MYYNYHDHNQPDVDHDTHILPQLYDHTSNNYTDIPEFETLMRHAPTYTTAFDVCRYGNTVSVVPPFSACSTLPPITFEIPAPEGPPTSYPERYPELPQHNTTALISPPAGSWDTLRHPVSQSVPSTRPPSWQRA